jgi:alanyl-tRNA synthetase
MKTDELREKYLEYFETQGCVRKPSDVLVPTWDPSVLFTPAGMNQFKDHFLGKVKLEFTRATTCQKCLRTGDIENVGRTAYHHTFFEMLGNFSFGDYFKREAIHWAWEFLTSKKWLGLEPARLSVTVYLDDDEAAKIWHEEIGVPESRISRCDEDENFWPASAVSQGPDGVCGPCSEIYYLTDSGKKVEIWNLVFTQFNRVGNPPDNLRPLPSKNIDTGMGLERCASVLQNVETNYHIDSLKPIVLAAAEIAGRNYVPDSDDGRRLRRITDHVRAATFAIHENVYPGPNKAPYVIRRLMRRAILDGYQMGLRDPFLWQLVPAVVDMMKAPYPELTETVTRVQGVIKNEENDFLGKIGNGLRRVDQVFNTMKSEEHTVVDGADSFDLYSTHGFPPELLESLAQEQGFTFDWPSFCEAMDQHGLVSGGGGFALFKTGPVEALKESVNKTEFVGYESNECDAQIVGLISTDGGRPDHLLDELDGTTPENPAIVVLDRSPFYAESGGQVGDSGTIKADGIVFEVTDTKKDGDLWLHIGQLKQGVLKTRKKVKAEVDCTRRQAIRRAHSATHILHHALQKYLGSHAQQKGSKVDADWLRFDFTNLSSVDRETLAQIEDDVNKHIIASEAIEWRNMPLADARSQGAMMLFGEKYPEIVRMVSMGQFSRELCGGTHLSNTGQVGLLKILSEESVSAGTRRITALTGPKALEHTRTAERQLQDVAAVLKAPVDELADRVANLVKEVKDLKKKVASGPIAANVSPESLIADAKTIDDVRVIVAEVPGAKSEGLRELIDLIRRKADPVAILLFGKSDDSVAIAAALSRGLVDRGLSGVDWLRAVTELVGGRGGGGKPDMAQGGGKDPSGIPAAIAKGHEVIKELMLAKK